MSVRDRLLKYIEFERIAVSEFERRANLSNGYVQKDRKRLSRDKRPYISSAFPRLNLDWVDTGEGDMLLDDNRAVSDYGGDVVLVPVLNLDARGGFMSNDHLERECTIGLMPFSREVAREGDFVIQVYGDSMAPKYQSGTMVLVRRIELWREYLELGSTYVLELEDERRVIKIIQKSDNQDCLKLVSINKDYDPTDIPKSLIHMVFRVIMSIQRESM